MQMVPEAPEFPGSVTATNMVVPPTTIADRLRHFPEEVYDLSPESHLSRFVKVLLGDAGAGQLRKRLFLARLRSTLQGSHFFDLDRFYGPIFGVRRNLDEILDFNPQDTATTAQWDEATAQDASFRSRIEQFSRALPYGPTPTGMELISEALLSIDCDVYESFIQADSSYQTYAELENLYGVGTPGGFYSDMEGVPYSQLEGEGLSRLSGDDRRVFTIRPKRRISQRESFDLRRVINKIKPADARLVIDFEGVPLHDPIPIDSITSDSEYWEIISEVTVGSSELGPYTSTSAEPTEQPRPPFAGYQGEAWSYNADMVGVSAYLQDEYDVRTVLASQRVTYTDSSIKDFPPDQAVLPRLSVQAGRVVSDGVFVVHPYEGIQRDVSLFQDSYLIPTSGGVGSLYADGVPIEALVDLLKDQQDLDPLQQNPDGRYWVTDQRYMGDLMDEVLEVRLADARLINYVTCEVSHFPHNMVIEVFTSDAEWTPVYYYRVNDSVPKIIPSEVEVSQRQGHPQHGGAGHWVKVGVRIEAKVASRIRIRLDRNLDGQPPQIKGRNYEGFRALSEVSYTLAVRSFDCGYRVTSREDFAQVDENGVISSTRDIAGSLVQFKPYELLAKNLLTDNGSWRCEPQPVNYAVVNLYVDTRGPGNGDGQVIDRWFLDPTHVGPHFTIYYSSDPQDTDGTDAFYEDRAWTPIPRDYTLHKGFVHIPTTRARYWKFEFTNLSIESYETFIPISRSVRLFPRALVEAMNRNYERTATEVPIDMLPTLAAVSESRYDDALNVLGVRGTEGSSSDSYLATESFYFPDLRRQAAAQDSSWVYGFIPWQQGDSAPRFSVTGRHVYETTEVRLNAKAAFFVGLRSIKAYRTSWEADDDTQVYLDTFDDFRNLEPGFTWTFDPGAMRSGTTSGLVQATSRTFPSLHNVSAVQFATVQSPPTQLVPDHDFRDPAFASHDWDGIDGHQRVGDAQLIYSPSDHTILNLRHVVPLPRVMDSGPKQVTEALVHPVFSYREYEVPDEYTASQTIGGLSTPLVGLSSEGRAYAAVRFTAIKTLTSPLYLQLFNNADGTVLSEKPLSAQKGQTIEDYLSYEIPGPEIVVRARLVQKGKSDDAWKVASLAVFDDGIVWEFSVNGGSDWYSAQSIRNNENGVLTFPDAGNLLKYRARATRINQWISAIKVRPWYVGVRNARTTGNHRGPNLSVYDQDIPINEDPLFTSWYKPIPASWFLASRKFPLLPVEGAPNITEFARFYGRPLGDTVPEPTDRAVGVTLHVRTAAERMDFFNPLSDVAVRKLFAFRSSTESIQNLTDSGGAQPIIGISDPVFSRIVRAVFSRTRNL